MYYSKDRKYPENLPPELQSLSISELNDLNWYGPIEMPPLEGTTGMTHRYEWDENSISFKAIELDYEVRRKLVQYDTFWENIIETNFYSNLKEVAKQNLSVNTLLTEFLILITDARNGKPQETKIQKNILELLSEINLSNEDLMELQISLKNSGMNGIYSLS